MAFALFQEGRRFLNRLEGPVGLRLTLWLVFGCGMLLALDLGGQVQVALVHPAHLSVATWGHPAGELLATLGHGLAVVLILGHLRRIASPGEADRLQLWACAAPLMR
ncbi:MAG: hypothetical protein ACK4L4_10690 [Gemmobacter sp.]